MLANGFILMTTIVIVTLGFAIVWVVVFVVDMV